MTQNVSRMSKIVGAGEVGSGERASPRLLPSLLTRQPSTTLCLAVCAFEGATTSCSDRLTSKPGPVHRLCDERIRALKDKSKVRGDF